MSEAELLRARAKCFLAWAVQTRERGDYKLAEYLVALSRECLDDAEALDVTRGQNPRSRIKTNLGRMRRSRRCYLSVASDGRVFWYAAAAALIGIRAGSDCPYSGFSKSGSLAILAAIRVEASNQIIGVGA